jgi:hypothetical protein
MGGPLQLDRLQTGLAEYTDGFVAVQDGGAEKGRISGGYLEG